MRISLLVFACALVAMNAAGQSGVFSSVSGVVNIPDGGSGAGCAVGNGALSPIAVTGQPLSISSLNISVRATVLHSSVDELTLLLIAPNGSQILCLHAEDGGKGQNLTATIYSDDGGTSIAGATAAAAPYRATFRPHGGNKAVCTTTPTVTSFSGLGSGGVINPNGTWTLKVLDSKSGNAGKFISWQLSLSGPSAFALAEQSGFLPRFTGEGKLVASKLSQAANGNIGLNQATPLYPFDVLGRSRIRYLGTAGIGGLILESSPFMNIGGDNTDLLYKTKTVYTARIGTRLSGDKAFLGFATGASADSSALKERLTIDNEGNVGIGTTTPKTQLEVAGNTQLGNAAITGLLSVGSAASIDGSLTVKGNALLSKLQLNQGSPADGMVLTSKGPTGIAEWRAVSTPVNVAFKSLLGKTLEWTKGEQTLNSLTELFDDGGGLDPASGTFTAPVAGTYCFVVDLVGLVQFASTDIISSIYVDNVKVETHRTVFFDRTVASMEGNINFTTLLKLNAGQKVSLRLTNQGKGGQVNIWGAGQSYFSGYKMY